MSPSLLSRTALVVALLASPALAHAKPSKKPPTLTEVLAQKGNEQAKGDYDAALVFAGNNDFASAETRMQSAYDRTKDPRVLYNLAIVQKKGAKYTTAIRTLDTYLQLASSDPEGRITDRDRADAEAFRKDLLLVTSPFEIEVVEKVGEAYVPVAGAKVTVDTEDFGATPLPATAKLNQRSNQLLRVTKDDYEPFEVRINVANPQGHKERVTLVRRVKTGTLEVITPEPYGIEVDGQVVGAGPVWSGPLSGGSHTLRVTYEGRRTYDARVEIVPGAAKRIELSKLEKTKSYTWVYVVSIAGAAAIVGGVVAYSVSTRDPVINPPAGSLGSFNP